MEEPDEKKQVRLAQGIPAAMLEAVPYMPYAVNHNWTPKQVDEEIPFTMRRHWHDVYRVFMEIRTDAEKKAIEDAKRQG